MLQTIPPQALKPHELAASKYPFISLRKSLRLLIDDIDNLDELENDISYVYSGYAPISIRLVQCVAQKGGVLSNPALDKTNKPTEGESGDGVVDVGSGTTKVQAHPIVGWKGFEDVLSSIPGETVDFVPKGLSPTNVVNPGAIVPSAHFSKNSILVNSFKHRSLFTGANQDHSRLFPRRLHIHGNCGNSVGCQAEQRLVADATLVFDILTIGR